MPVSARPTTAIDRELRLPRRGLSLGATGAGGGERRFKLVASIDRGGMGELFLAEMTDPQQPPRYVVVKRLLADLLDDDKYIKMFVSEADVMSKLGHPNIVRVFDTPTIDGAQCLAMEYVRGRNVQQILARLAELDRKMEPAIVLRVMSQVLRGLDYAHNFRLADGTPLNLVHRDVTPGNVLVSFEGDVKLTDFGIAKHEMSAVSTTVGIVKGKARYLAPEQILGERATPRSDIFSAAAVVVEMLTGTPLFDRGTVPKTLYAIVNGEREDLETMIDFRAPLLVQLLSRALATDPRARLQTARELAEGLDAAARLLGKPHDREAVGTYLREAYRDVDDPLARFDSVTRLSSGPKMVRAVSSPVLPERAREEHDDGARTVTAAPIAPINDPDTSPRAEQPSKEALRAASLSAHGGAIAPSAVIRGTPVSPGPEASGSEDASPAAVDEALSVLAWLQSSHGPPAAEPAPLAAAAQELVKRAGVPEDGPAARSALAERSGAGTPEPARAPSGRAPWKLDPATAQAIWISQRAPMAIVFTLGALSGVFATLAMQVFFREEPPPAPIVAPAPAPITTAPVVIEEEPDPFLEDESGELAEAQELDQFEDEETVEVPPVSGPASGIGTFDLFEPRGARVRIDGELLKDRLPLKGVPIKAGRHRLRIYTKRSKRDLVFTIEGSEHIDLTPRLKRRAK